MVAIFSNIFFTQDSYKAEISENEMRRIAKDIADINVLAAHLNMSNDLDAIKAKNPGETVCQSSLLLKQWHDNGGNRLKLAWALDEADNSILATQ